jgi:hypothetical protein
MRRRAEAARSERAPYLCRVVGAARETAPAH